MEQIDLSKLLLRTAFACMACDGDIDQREVDLIKRMHKEEQLFGDINLERRLDKLFSLVKQDGALFVSQYFNAIEGYGLSEVEEMKLVEIAVATIRADDKIEYEEVKFFKVIRSKLKISDEKILEKHPDFGEFLEYDVISESYLLKLEFDSFGFKDVDSSKLEGINFDEL